MKKYRPPAKTVADEIKEELCSFRSFFELELKDFNNVEYLKIIYSSMKSNGSGINNVLNSNPDLKNSDLIKKELCILNSLTLALKNYLDGYKKPGRLFDAKEEYKGTVDSILNLLK